MKTLRLIPVLFIFLTSMAMAEISRFKKLDINKDKLLSKNEIGISVFGIDNTSAVKDAGALEEEIEYVSFVEKLRKIELNKSIKAELEKIKNKLIKFEPYLSFDTGWNRGSKYKFRYS